MPRTILPTMIVGLLGLAGPVLAEGDSSAPIAPAPAPDYAWVTPLVAVVLVLAVIVASFMSSRRSHQE